MNVRVFLLLLFSAVFMSVWAADQRAEDAAIARKCRDKLPIAHQVANPETAKIGASAQADAVPQVSVSEAPVAELNDDVQKPQPHVADANHQASAVVAGMPTDEVGPELPSDYPADAAGGDVANFVNAVAEPDDHKVYETKGDVIDVVEPEVDSPLAEYEPADQDQEADSISESDEEFAAVQIDDSVVDGDPSAIETPEVDAYPLTVMLDDESGSQVSERSSQTDTTTNSTIAPAGSVVLQVSTPDSCIPLPKNLASGTWQVMSPSGESFNIRIDRSAVETPYGDFPRAEPLENSFCISETPVGVRWCFVRSFAESRPVRGPVLTEFFAPSQH